MSKRLCEKIVSEGGVGGEEEELCGGGHEGEEMDVWEEGLEGWVDWQPGDDDGRPDRRGRGRGREKTE